MTPPKGQLAHFRAFELQEFETSPTPMCLFDRETLRCLAVNDAALRLYGYARNEFLPLTLSDTRHPDDDHGFEHGGGSTLPRHWGLRRHIKRSGDVFLADIVVQDVLYEERHAKLILLLDRPERRQIPALRPEREQLFSALVEHSPDVIARIDRQLRHVYVNPAVEAATGIPAEELMGKSERQFTAPPELCVRWAAGIRRAFATGRQQEIDISVPTPEGERYYATHMVPEIGADGRIDTVLAIARDVTDRKLSEVALRASEARLRQAQSEFEALADELPQVITCYDRQLRHTYANAATERATGVPRTQIIGRTDAELGFPSELAEQWNRSLRRALETGAPSTVELDYPAPDEPRRYEVTHIPLTQKGVVEGVICVGYDLTERKRAEDERLSLMSRQRDALVREVHHRVKNNLQGVVGLLRQLARVHVDLAPLLDKAVSQLHAMGIVHGLQGREWRDGVMLDGLVAEIAKAAERTTGVAVSYTFGPSANARAYVREQDAVAVALIMHELILNACKHGSDEGGKPVVKVAVVIDSGNARIAIVNRGQLPAGFDFNRGRELGTGLDLVKALLPLDGAQLAFTADEREVLAVLNLDPPVLAGTSEAAKEMANDWNRRQSASSDRRR